MKKKYLVCFLLLLFVLVALAQILLIVLIYVR